MLMTDLTDFLTRHRSCGKLTGDATKPANNGYMVEVACSCGVVSPRPESALPTRSLVTDLPDAGENNVGRCERSAGQE